ncbi:TAXI family TRAP transporter solute-binding subunit [Methylopila sp. 73B]|uniref:TAXI family TRAP transporter solute-binding subunit n=1 Tax=Methylopila sp. 73B TaxID=1120792 RepID=UPI00036B7227|nr:TAXI family TRAP transporter solute-binding subunit [Methylopila sp. 73B]
MIKTETSRRAVLRAIAASSALALAPSLSVAAETPLRLGTSTPGGGFTLYGETLAQAANAQAGETLVSPVGTSGTAENLRLLAEGRLDLALIQGTAASQALTAEDASGLRIVFAMYPSPGMLAVPRDSPARRFEDLKGLPVVFGVRASGLVLLARQVFGAIGLDVDRDFQAVYVGQAAESPERVIDGEAAGLWGAGEGWPGFARLAASPRGARFFGPLPEQIPRILAAHPFLTAMAAPAGAYPGLDADLPTVGSWNLILGRSDLAAERVRRFADAVHAAAKELAAALPQAAMTTAARTAEAAPAAALIHPGTAGLLRDLKLLPG